MNFSRKFVFVFLGLFLCSSCSVSGQGQDLVGTRTLTVLSWNIKHLGRRNLDQQIVTSLLQTADIITFQEVNKNASGLAALTNLKEKLQESLKLKLCMGLSEIPTDSQERYAYLWRDARVSYVKTNG